MFHPQADSFDVGNDLAEQQGHPAADRGTRSLNSEEPAAGDQSDRDREGDESSVGEVKALIIANVRKIELFRNDQERGRKSQPSIQHFEKIFGRGPYKYSLVLADPLPKILYKERNFSLNVILVDLNSNLVCNSIAVL